MAEHRLALVALLYLPVALLSILTLIAVAARAGSAMARGCEAAYLAGSPALKLAALFMLVSATIHFALIPEHICAQWTPRMPFSCPHSMPMMGEMQEPYTAMLFALDGIGLAGTSVLMFFNAAWKAAAVSVLVATILAYGYYLGSGREEADAIGIATKLIEVTAIALIVIPRRVPHVSVTTPVRVPVRRTQFSRNQEIIR